MIMYLKKEGFIILMRILGSGATSMSIEVNNNTLVEEVMV